ncbi:MAG: NAD(P)-dependent glycerol-3-phosphate dehydrogenase [Proteobacteria bacterium]|nr:NAD(P)-dependent glycerol-3-phosphate dehydrogenase [Pseudomonadota bacterium]MBU1708560.1 NAD(P)-dependent glycerol-3-phosphate dehydrogenase [Pseudomonadota bacterium]
MPLPSNSLDRVAVIGAGSWGTALAKHLSDQGRQVFLWAHKKEHVEAIKQTRENSAYLPGFPLNENLFPTDDIAEAVGKSKAIVMVVPSHVYREVFTQVVPYLLKDAFVISAAKGIENNTLLTMNQVMAEVLSDEKIDTVHLGVLAGPSFAKEVAQQIPTAVTVAAKTQEDALFFQKLFFSERFRVYGGTDIIGTELGGALKNIVAIAAGICDGLKFGTNTRAALITRGLAEITRLGVKMGAQPLTFSGLAGMGDLVLTCTGDLSRNRYVGLKLGQGRKINEIIDEMKMVAEGVKTTASAKALAEREGVDMPILDQVYGVLYKDKPCNEAVHALLTRDQKDEIDSTHS